MSTTPGPAPSRVVRPADRYGDRPTGRRRHLGIAALAVLGAVSLAWVVWAGVGAAQRDVRWDDVGYVVVDDTAVEVTFSVVKQSDATAVCDIQALNARYARVGLASVEVGPDERRAVTRTVTVRTAERAVTGIVEACSLR